MSSGATSTGGRRTSPAAEICTSLKSGVPPGRTAGAGTWNDRRFRIGHGASRLNGLD